MTNDIVGRVKPPAPKGYRLYSAARLCAVITNLRQGFDSEVVRILEMIGMGACSVDVY